MDELANGYSHYKYINWAIEPTGRKKTKLPSLACETSYLDGRVELCWLPVKGAAKYIIYRSSEKTKGYKKIKTVTGFRHTDRKADSFGTLYYKVTAVTEDGKRKGDPVAVRRRLAAPELMTGIDGEAGDLVLIWEPVKGAGKYRAYVRNDITGKWKKLATTNANNYVYTGKKSYPRFKVVAVCTYDSKGNSLGSVITAERNDSSAP